MTDKRTIDGDITTEVDGGARVAYDLMNTISAVETGAKDRNYYLKLYAQCRWVTKFPARVDEASKFTT